MSRHHAFYDTVNELAAYGAEQGILYLQTEDKVLNGNSFRHKDREVVNFGSCSYLGLEFDARMKAAAIEAVENYGTQFSAARIYVSSRHYGELEEKIEQIFEAPAIVAPTTTLGHIATIPVLFRDDDAVILDHQAHNSMQNAVNLMKFRGTHVEMIRHNRMDMLEERVKKLRQKYKRIWYMADGIFSMYGDGSPVTDVYVLMDKYPELYYYVDDAHGMSCFGKHGRGYVLSRAQMHEKMILVTSLNKAFASGGSALVFPNKEWAQKVKNTGGPFLSSGPMQPAALGAAIAAADIHLSDEIYSLQEDLQENIKYTNMMLHKYGLPNVTENDSAVFFVGVGLPKMGFNLIKRLLKDGYYTNIGVFPTVPMKNTGVRFTITRLHTFEQIENMIEAMAHHYPLALKEEGFTLDQVYRAFKMQPPEEEKMQKAVTSLIKQSELEVQHTNSIRDINQDEWDSLLGDRGSFDWNGMQFLEDSFTGNDLTENNWKFDYIIIKDKSGKPVLATFFTTALCKDDMLAPAEVSRQIEEKRRIEDPHFLTSRTIMMGSLLTEGNHLYLDKGSPYWKDAMQELFDKITELQDMHGASVTNLRDFDPEDKEMDALLLDNGYFKILMPENHIIENLDWNTTDEYLETLSKKSRRHVREFVLRYSHYYETKVIEKADKSRIKIWWDLYNNVRERSLALNTFPLPMKTFELMLQDKNWDILELCLTDSSASDAKKQTVAVMFSYLAGDVYSPMILGIDYRFQQKYKCYRQALYQVLMRAKKLGCKRVRLGYSASIEKRKFGAKVFTPAAYIQTKDNFNMEVLGTMSVLQGKK